MRNAVKKIFRYPMQDILFICACIASCILIITFSVYRNQMKRHREAMHPYVSQIVYRVTGDGCCFENTDSDRKIIESYRECPYGNLFLYAEVSMDYASPYKAEFLITQHEPLIPAYTCVNEMTTDSMENAVILGTDWKDYCISDLEGETFFCMGCKFNVIGYFDSTFAQNRDDMVFLWDTLTDTVKEEIFDFTYGQVFAKEGCYVYSNSADYLSYVEGWKQSVQNTLERVSQQAVYDFYGEEIEGYTDITVGTAEIDGLTNAEEWYESYQNLMYPFGIIFSFFVLCHTMSICMKKRKQECMVRLSMGYTRRRLCFHLLKRFACLMGIALLISVPCSFLLMSGDITYDIRYTELVVFVGGGMLVMISICMLCILHGCSDLTQCLREE